MASPRLHREYREYRNLQGPPVSGSSGPAEWGGLSPVADWDPVNSVLSGANVVSVTDSSGNGNTLTGSGTVLPQYIATDPDYAGKPSWSVASDGNLKRFVRAAIPAIADSGPLAVAAVCKSINVANNSNRYVITMGSGDMGLYHQESQTRWSGWVNDGGATMITTTGNNPATPVSLLLRSGGVSTNQLIYAGTDVAEATAASGVGAITYNNIIVGAHSSASDNFCLNGTIARVILFNQNPSPAQVTLIMNALFAKYGV